MAGTKPTTAQEAYMDLLKQVSVAMAAPDANLEELTQLQQQILKTIRQPYDTASPGSPAAQGAAMDMSAGATAPSGTAPGQLSPMLAALMGPQNSPGITPSPTPNLAAGGGVGAPPGAPNMDEVRRMLSTAGGRGQ